MVLSKNVGPKENFGDFFSDVDVQIILMIFLIGFFYMYVFLISLVISHKGIVKQQTNEQAVKVFLIIPTVMTKIIFIFGFYTLS